MKIDNFDLIKPLFYFNEANNMFFHCQIVVRAKDHKNSGRKISESAIQTYFIRSKEHLEQLKPEIMLLCDHYGARAYINVAGKDFGEVNKLVLSKLGNYNLTSNIGCINPSHILNSAAGEVKSRMRRWVVDVDDPDMDMIDNILKWLDNYSWMEECKNVSLGDYSTSLIYATIPTKSGLHYITSPFNTKEFNKVFPEVMIHKNSMGTLLYCNV